MDDFEYMPTRSSITLLYSGIAMDFAFPSTSFLLFFLPQFFQLAVLFGTWSFGCRERLWMWMWGGVSLIVSLSPFLTTTPIPQPISLQGQNLWHLLEMSTIRRMCFYVKTFRSALFCGQIWNTLKRLVTYALVHFYWWTKSCPTKSWCYNRLKVLEEASHFASP